MRLYNCIYSLTFFKVYGLIHTLERSLAPKLCCPTDGCLGIHIESTVQQSLLGRLFRLAHLLCWEGLMAPPKDTCIKQCLALPWLRQIELWEAEEI